MMRSAEIKDGIYLVIDPSMERNMLLRKLKSALKGGLTAVQIWKNWLTGADRSECITAVAAVCHSYGVPLLVEAEWKLLIRHTELDGVHFDEVPENYEKIKEAINRPFLAGITCSGNLDVVKWAHANKLDYVSFCAMFPSLSAGTCSIVMPETVRQAHALTNIPLFVSGGITPNNIPALKQLTPFNGVAVISGIMSAENPSQKVKLYHKALNNQKL